MITDRRAMVWGVLLVALTLLVSAQAAGGSPGAKGADLQREHMVCPGEEVAPAEVAALAKTEAAVPFPMSETFEGTWPGAWILRDSSTGDGGEFLMGKRDCHPHSGSYAGWSVGGGAQGVNLTCEGTYPNNAKSWAIYGPFSLAGVSSASLTFYLYGQAEGGENCPYDYLFVGSSIDGTHFAGGKYCGNWTSGPDGNGYYRRTLDLSDRLGQAQVWIAFAFISDGSYAYNGFHVDDITLQIPKRAFLPLIQKNQPAPVGMPD